jgi:hypothetical protein
MPTRRTGPSSLLLRLLAACLLIAAFSGCYTLVRHPGIPELNYQRPPADSPCASCHKPGERLAFVSSQRLDRPPGPWGELTHPWWFKSTDDSTRSDGAVSH